MRKTRTDAYYTAIHKAGGSLFADNLGIVFDCVKRYKDLPEYVQDDLIQEGAMALFSVVEMHPNENVLWYTYVFNRIRWVARREIKEKKIKKIDIDSLEI